MKKLVSMLAVAFLAALIPTIIGQEAKIMIVEKSDSSRLFRAYREFKDAQNRWEEVKAAVSKQYTFDGGKVLPGWEKIQFSADFRAIVPDSSQYASHSNWGPCYMGYTTTLSNISGSTSPANGTSTLSTLPITSSTELSVDSSLTTKESKK